MAAYDAGTYGGMWRRGSARPARAANVWAHVGDVSGMAAPGATLERLTLRQLIETVADGSSASSRNFHWTNLQPLSSTRTDKVVIPSHPGGSLVASLLA